MLCTAQPVLPAEPLAAERSEDPEIAYLLAFVERSDCVFIRNDTEHGAKDAARHMKRKYDQSREKIHSAEEFIALAATKSTLTGKAYLVRCPNSPAVPAAEWLSEHLARHRAGGSGSSPQFAPETRWALDMSDAPSYRLAHEAQKSGAH